jgi:hypothetical protein
MTDSGLHLSSYSMGAAVLLGGKRLRGENDHSTPSSAQVREWALHLVPLHAFMEWTCTFDDKRVFYAYSSNFKTRGTERKDTLSNILC